MIVVVVVIMIVVVVIMIVVVIVGRLRIVLLQRDRGYAPGLVWDPSLHGYVPLSPLFVLIVELIIYLSSSNK